MARPKGGYRLKNNERVIGVTTAIGRFKDSGALLWWAFAQGKLAEQGLIDSLYDKRDEAASAGTLAHEMVEAYIRGGGIPDMSEHSEEVLEQARRGYKNYRNWEKMNNIEVIEQEVSLVSERYGYGGTLDGVFSINGELALGDWKTAKGVYTDNLAQLASYKQLWEENNPDRPITGGYHLCRFSRENADFSHHYWENLDDAWEYFKLCLKMYRLDKKLKKRV